MKKMDFLRNQLIFHRGCHGVYPENSIESIRLGVKKGYPIEIDVHLTLDNKVVVFHDDCLKRACGVDKFVKNYVYNDLKKLKLFGTNYHIPTISDVLKIVNGKVPLIIELKYDRMCGLLEREIVKFLDDYHGEFCVKSFSPFSVLWFRIHRPNYIRGLLISNKRKSLKERLLSSRFIICICRPDFISCNYRLYNNRNIIRFRGPVIAWTIRNDKLLSKYKDKFDSLIVENIDFN